MNQYTLSEITIYPVKSLGGIKLAEANVFGKGLEWDRRWMIVDQELRALTQREMPAMTAFQVLPEKDRFLIRHGDSVITLPHGIHNGNALKTRIWNDVVDTVEVDEKISNWITEKLNHPCKLVYFPETNNRKIPMTYQRNNEDVSLADGFPVLLIGQASLDDLNSRLEQRIEMIRFRPNFVVTGSAPYEEDSWSEIRIGSASFHVVKPCSRCVIPTLDPITGAPGKEPTRTLATYRRHGNDVWFGQNLLGPESGVVRVGDPVTVEHRKTKQ